MWDPKQYLAFAEQRDRPAHDLLARVGAETARRVTDLGCGAGTLTPLLTSRWPEAAVEAIDSSPEMVRAARANGIEASVEDARNWRPRQDTDVVVCNAVLQWIPGHVDLLRNWIPALPSGAWFALQVPGNFDSPSYQEIRELAAEPEWREHAAGLLRSDSVLAPVDYADVLADLGAEVDAWESTYVHALSGEDPVLDWVSGTALRPVRAALDERRWQRFRAELATRLRERYPRRSGGTTWFPFRRIFAVARRR
ncbi:trans-aconitate 2-methyltransferase [Saccharopolyspora lacisalsi]|uniref:Trans-aconitate 2-methyltransferase n=1 Tax=Halosaccharopolyspora lacisalsi TaxID=1000566 RepID=A0A839E245_9PSEU|nr:trans-aconitate 2-methyltransferase [Halosaccharopolyspora lacisalsi]MBA8825481.1 trans-aconitate 2-methyltransferase [Halosaccharopolyspora lacisalsi]